MSKVFSGRRRFSHLFFGDTTHLINFFINKIGGFERMHLVDDGTSTPHRVRQIAEHTLHLQRKNFSFRHPALSAVMLRLCLCSDFHYRACIFTIYDISEPLLREPVVPNSRQFCRARLGEKAHNGEVWFIESNIRREILFNLDDYAYLLDQVHRQIDRSRAVNIHHRKAPDDYLAILSKRFDMEIAAFLASSKSRSSMPRQSRVPSFLLAAQR